MFNKLLQKFKIILSNARKGCYAKKACKEKTIIYPSFAPYVKKDLQRRKKIIRQPIDKYYIPLKIMQLTDLYMSKHRKISTECFIFWGGYLINAHEAQIVSVYYPKAINSYGRVYLSTKDITLLNQALRKRDQLLLIELHTHPPGATIGIDGQNKVDASNGLCCHKGFISIIVPDFGAPHFYDFRNHYVFEYENDCEWKQLSYKEIEKRFIIEDSVIEIGNV